jgi:type II secretory pathway pseudopilin PulG
MLIKKKYSSSAFSLIEVLVAMFVLGMITLVVINSNTTFLTSQQKIVNNDRRDQLADLIIQDIIDYTAQQSNPYGVVTTAGQQVFNGSTSTITFTSTNGFSTLPSAGDLFLVNGLAGRYTVQSVAVGAMGIVNNGIPSVVNVATITAQEIFPAGTIAPSTAVTFIALKQNDLQCFEGLNLNNNAPTSSTNCATLPIAVRDLHNHWKSIIDTELGANINVRNVNVSPDGLVRVTLGDGNNNTILAKKINTCIYNNQPTTVGFTFPGTGVIQTGILSGTQDPVTHYYASGVAQRYPNLNNDNGSVQNLSVTCTRINASTCRQSYAWMDSATVFLYRYTGTTTLRVRPSGCDESIWAGQCAGVVINPNDLSLWFIFDEYNNSNDTEDTNLLGYSIPGSNEQGFIQFTLSNLPANARIVVFDDNSESCLNNIQNGTCNGAFRWNNAHDGMVISLGTSNLNSLSNLQLALTGVPFGIDRWRVLNTQPNCLIASDMSGSAHGTEFTQEAENTCWTTITANSTTLSNAITANSTTIQVADSSIFPSSGNLQIGSEFVNYTSNNTTTNVISGISRGIRTNGTLVSQIPSSGFANNSVVSIGGAVGAPQISAFGGYAEINNEVFQVDYGKFSNALTGFNNGQMRFIARAQNGTSAATHAVGSAVRNWDRRAQSHAAGTRVWEGATNSTIVVQAQNGTSYPVTRIKRSITLNLSTSAVCD